jgi:hypothetical protein
MPSRSLSSPAVLAYDDDMQTEKSAPHAMFSRATSAAAAAAAAAGRFEGLHGCQDQTDGSCCLQHSHTSLSQQQQQEQPEEIVVPIGWLGPTSDSKAVDGDVTSYNTHKSDVQQRSRQQVTELVAVGWQGSSNMPCIITLDELQYDQPETPTAAAAGFSSSSSSSGCLKRHRWERRRHSSAGVNVTYAAPAVASGELDS